MNGRDCRATFYIKVSKRSNREHELRARKPPTKDKADKKSKPWKNRRGFHYRVMFFSIDYASYPFFFFSRREHSIIFPSTIQNSNVSVFLNPFIPPPIPFPLAFVCIQSGYASERHFLPRNPRRWNRGTVFPFFPPLLSFPFLSFFPFSLPPSIFPRDYDWL